MKYRASQKLDMIRPLFKDSISDPAGFLTSLICSWCIDIGNKLESSPIYRESMDFLQNTSLDKSSRFLALYSQFLKDLADYWLEHGAIESLDIIGITNVIVSVSVLLSNSDKFEGGYFKVLIEDYISTGIARFIKVKEH